MQLLLVHFGELGEVGLETDFGSGGGVGGGVGGGLLLLDDLGDVGGVSIGVVIGAMVRLITGG